MVNPYYRQGGQEDKRRHGWVMVSRTSDGSYGQEEVEGYRCQQHEGELAAPAAAERYHRPGSRQEEQQVIGYGFQHYLLLCPRAEGAVRACHYLGGFAEEVEVVGVAEQLHI